MATINRVHGQVSAGAVYGYSPLVVRVINSDNAFTADSVNATTGVITEGGYAKAVRVIQTFGSIIMLSARTDAGSICVIVDGPTFNQVAGATTAGAFGALRDAMVAAANTVAGITTNATNTTVTSGTSLANTGAFTLA